MVITSLLSAAARRCSRSASAIVRREVTGFHDLTIDGCAASRKSSKLRSVASPTFEAAGHRWRIWFYPRGRLWARPGAMSVYLELANGDSGAADRLDEDDDDDPVEIRFSLLDQDGNPLPKHTRSKSDYFFNVWPMCKGGFANFVKWKDVEESGCLKDDRITIRCDIMLSRNYSEDVVDDDDDCAAAAAPARVVVPPSDLHEHLGGLLRREHGTTDVTIDAGGGATYGAHGSLLAVRSPVFAAELAAATKKSGSGGIRGPTIIKVEGIEPRMMKAMLHFIYTDTLPPEMAAEQEEEVAMARSLLAAAARYKLDRLKLVCEEKLCERIGVDTVAGNLALARQHGCQVLAAVCMEFIARPGNLKAVTETHEFHKIKASSPGLFIDLLMKKLA
ncbi:unnamed protein product [Urochloa decumbens]|uniref:Uncharacterized protein n=1 Tax=Urochloa decumbens TaxID=240449 RepID=A0ABC8VXU7_9POAL